MEELKIDKVWLTDNEIWIQTADGKQACEKIADYPRLRLATPGQRERFTLSPIGIHWPELDEDLSFEGFFTEKRPCRLYQTFTAHPELNASAVARRMGIPQSLFARYVSGSKRPSKEREAAIFEELRAIGAELQALTMA